MLIFINAEWFWNFRIKEQGKYWSVFVTLNSEAQTERSKLSSIYRRNKFIHFLHKTGSECSRAVGGSTSQSHFLLSCCPARAHSRLRVGPVHFPAGKTRKEKAWRRCITIKASQFGISTNNFLVFHALFLHLSWPYAQLLH